MSLLRELFGGGKVATLRAWHPLLSNDAVDLTALRRDFDSPRHALLRDLMAGAVAPEAVQQVGANAPAFLAEVALRLALARRVDPGGTGVRRTLWLSFHEATRLVHGRQALPALTVQPQDIVDLAWAAGSMLGGELADCSPVEMVLIASLDAGGSVNYPTVRAALMTLLARIDAGSRNLQQRQVLADAVVTRLGLGRAASATLVALDADVAARMARRAAMTALAGPLLAPVSLAALDKPEQLRAKGADLPEMAALLAAGAAAAGQALVALARIERECLTPPYTNLAWLSLESQFFEPEVRSEGSTRGIFEVVRGAILRRRVEIGDAGLAVLVAGLPDYPIYFVQHRKPDSNAYRSKSFLDLAVRMAKRPEGAATRAALMAVMEARPATGQFVLPALWREVITAVTGFNEAEADALPLPDLSVGRHHDYCERLAAHFANLLDRRLHDKAHADLLAGLVANGTIADAPTPLEATLPGQPLHSAAAGRSFITDVFERQRVQHLGAAARAIQGELAAVWSVTDEEAAGLRAFGEHCRLLAGKTAPTIKWLVEGRRQVAAMPDAIIERLLRSLSAQAPPDPPVRPAGLELMRGLIFLSADWAAAWVGPLLADFALGKCYQTVPGFGIRAEKLGNACLWALINMPDGAGVPYLARMLARVKYPKVRKKLDAALNEAAAAAGLSRGALDELSVPAHGLDQAGTIRLPVGDGEAVIAVTGNREAGICWMTAEGKRVKAPAAAMKADKAGLATVKALAKEIEADLGAQTVRLQRIYLEARDWPVAEWRARYLEHPLLRGLSQRLLWWLDRAGTRIAVLPRGDTLTDIDGNIIDASGMRIALWHPIDADPAEVLRWRDRIEAEAIVQPFAQVWREIYRLTDAEGATATYTNRWAGHILKQHQFMTLARLNGWTVTHRMWVDAPNDAPAHLVVPAFGLIADYWVEGAGGDDPEVLDSQAYVYVATDRLAFSRIDGVASDSAYGPGRNGAVELADVPPIVLSEVMRHCDLFTAVASIAADPMWRDRGRDAGHPNQWQATALRYWDAQSFGDMSEAAKMRRALLERVVPKLAIAARCSFDEQALCVEGTRHRYRIHIGSAAILIMPEKRHLCIVPATAAERDFYVPFEGDRTLSLIISKAVILAADDKITDTVILRQL